ncbi:MAG: P-loop NTPase fold protein, partial [Streptosporangiaceae bacterium]
IAPNRRSQAKVRLPYEEATVYLPADLFEGPIVSGPLAEPGAIPLGSGGEPLHDALFRARSGALYLYQHDTRELLEYVQSQGYELIVFIDDLDRCTARTTAEVFEAVNLFLADPRLAGRFVMAFDPVVVAAHMNSFYSDLDSKWSSHGDDPGPGWAFLRKLVQRPVLVPAVDHSDVKRFVDTVIRADTTRLVPEPPSPVTTIKPEPSAVTPRGWPTAGTSGGLIGENGARGNGSKDPGPRAEPHPAPASSVPLEASPEISALIEQRLADQPDLTIREAKRLINVWQFYAHLLDLLYPEKNGQAAVVRGCHLVILAEIITRWPALLRSRSAGRGLDMLAQARDDSAAWDAARAALGLDAQEHDSAMRNLRELLQGYDGPAVGRLAALLF